MKLLEYLQEKDHDATGTIRSNRVEKAPLKDLGTVKKLPRGTHHQVTDEYSKITCEVQRQQCGHSCLDYLWCRTARKGEAVEQCREKTYTSQPASVCNSV